MSSTTGDMEIINTSVITGDVFSYPPLDVKLQIGDGTKFERITYWCNFIRGEYKRQEDEREWKAKQAAEEKRQEAVLGRSDTGENPRATVKAGDVVRTGKDLQVVEVSLEAFARERINYVMSNIKRLRAENNEAVQKLALFEEELLQLQEICNDPPQVRGPMGRDIHPEVQGDDSNGSRGVGDKDSPAPVPQATSDKGEDLPSNGKTATP